MTVKICATCKHLQVIEQGREFQYIIDTEYTLFKCALANKTVKEFYLMIPVEEELKVETKNECIFWEPWKSQP